MTRITKRIFGFIGFMLSVWLFGGGRNANAGFMIGGDDVAAASRRNTAQSFDAGRFARTGEVVKNARRANLFAYACIGNCVVPADKTSPCSWGTSHADGCATSSTYFYSC
jgi:hypothetical protein